jgi:hypothetical protein
VLPLVVGAGVYLFLRPANFLSRFFKVNKHLTFKSALVQQIVFTLPDFCWSYSLAMAVYLYASFYQCKFWATTVSVFTILLFSELVQLCFPSHFTFDPYDLVATVLAFILSTLYINAIGFEKKNY